MSSLKKKGKGAPSHWTLEEDVLLMKAVSKYGEGDWDTIQKNSGVDHSSVGCEVRWCCYIKPGLVKGKFTQEEEDKMMHHRYKKALIRRNKWIEIAKEIPGVSAFDVETSSNSFKMQTEQASRTQQLVDDSQAAHNPADTTRNTSMFGQGSVSSQFPDLDSKYEQGYGSYQFPDPENTFGQGSGPSQFPGSKFAQGLVSSQFYDPNSKFQQGLGSSEFLDPNSMFAQGSGYSQFPAVFPSPVMQQHNNLDSTFSSTPAAGPAFIDRFTGLSGNAGLPLLTGGTETHQGSLVIMSSSKERGERLKMRWTVEEDERLMKAVIKYGEGDWDTIQKNSGLDRSSIGCTKRWTCHIKPGLIKGKFTQEEEDKMKMMHLKRYKKVVMRRNKWIEIAKEIPGLSAFDVETSRTQQLVGDSQAAHNPADPYMYGNTSMFGQGSVSSQFPDPYMYGKVSSMFVQGSVPSQFPDLDSKYAQGYGSYQFPDPESTFGQGSGPSQFPGSKFAQGLVSSQFSDPNNKFDQGLRSSEFLDPNSTFAQGSGSSQFPAVSPSPVMQQHNNLDSNFISTPAAGPALIDQFTGLSGNAGLPLLTGGTETHQGSSSSSNMLKRSISSLDKPHSPRDNGNSEGLSDEDLSISEEDLNRLRNILREMIEAFN